MNKFCIIINSQKEEAETVGRQIVDYLTVHGKYAEIVYSGSDERLKETDCAIVLGGDGTILIAAEAIKEYNIPILGVNLGTLGFLAETEPQNIYKTLEMLLAGEYEIEERMMLEANVIKSDGSKGEKFHAINDVVLTRGGLLSPIGVSVFVNGIKSGDYFGDGIMVSTPTGSTGYNISAGGPIAIPQAKLMLITPICAHSLNARTIIVSDLDEVSIKLTYNKKVLDEEAVLTMDGGRAVLMHANETVIIKKSIYSTKVIRFSDSNFFDILRKKLVTARSVI